MTARTKYTRKEIQLMTTLGVDQDEESVGIAIVKFKYKSNYF